MTRTGVLLRTTALATLVAVSAPAVVSAQDASNSQGMLSFSVGDDDGTNFQFLSGSYLLPFDSPLTFQVDGIVGHLGGEVAHGIAAHMFMRSEMGLIGLYAESSDAQVDGAGSLQRIAFEGEYYSGDFGVGALVGYQDGDLGSGVFGQLSLAASFDSGASIFAQYSHQPDFIGDVFTVGGSYQAPGSNISFFADASYRDRDDSYSAQIGVRMFFGGPQVEVTQDAFVGNFAGGLVGTHFDLFRDAASAGANLEPEMEAPEAPI